MNTLQDLSQRAREEAETLAVEILGEQPTTRRGDQMRFGKKGSLSVFISGHRQGSFTSFEDDNARGDIIDLYCWAKGASKKEAIEWLQSRLGISIDRNMDPERAAAAEAAAKKRAEQKRLIAEKEEIANKKIRMDRARRIWDKSSDRPYSCTIAYLESRGIPVVADRETMRHRMLDRREAMAMANGDASRSPTHSLVFAARNASGEISAIQEIFLKNGKKADIDVKKRSMGVVEGSSVLLRSKNPSTFTVVAEGPETALSIWMAIGCEWNVRISLGSSNISKISYDETEKVIILAADLEESGGGLASVIEGAQKLADIGKDARIAIPNLANGDFNDVLQKSGPGKVSEIIRNAWIREDNGTTDIAFVTHDPRAAFYLWAKTVSRIIIRRPQKKKDSPGFHPVDIGYTRFSDSIKKIIIIQDPEVTISGNAMTENRTAIVVEKGPFKKDVMASGKSSKSLLRLVGLDKKNNHTISISPPLKRIG